MDNINYENLLKDLSKQEEALQFQKFTNEMALEIGLAIVKKAKESGKTVTIDVSKNRQQIFYYSFEGTAPDNDNWIVRKRMW